MNDGEVVKSTSAVAAVKSTIKLIPGSIPLARIGIKILQQLGLISRPANQAEAGQRQKSPLIKLLARKAALSEKDVDQARQEAADAIAIWSILESKIGNQAAALEAISKLPDASCLTTAVANKIWPYCIDLGRYDIALTAMKSSLDDTEDKRRLQHRIDHLLFSKDAFRYYSNYVSDLAATDPKGYVILFDLGSRVTTGLMVPLSYQLLKDGYCVCSVVAGTMPKSKRPELADISASIRTNGESLIDEGWGMGSFHNDWIINWEAGEVSCDGINYYSYFLERISKLQRSYRGGIEAPEAKALFDNILRRSDLALIICKRILRLAKQGKPIRIVSMDTHFAPWGVVRRWCEEVGRDFGIHMVALSIAYENYFSNLSSIEASTISVEDMTARPDLRHPFLGGRFRFEQYIKSAGLDSFSKEIALSWIKVDRSRTSTADASARSVILNRVLAEKKNGKKIFCAMGKVLIDFAAPDDRGNVYPDFVSWINRLIDLSSSTASLLLVKPHPHEVRAEIVQSGVQRLRDLLPIELPPNVIFLDHATFNSSEIAEFIDVALVWNGTICAEFPVLGCPVVAESVWAERDYPLDSYVARSDVDYEDIFKGVTEVPLSDETISRAIAYLHFMRSVDVAIPFGYVKRAGTNEAIGPNVFYEDQLAELEQNGDPNVVRAARRFFESKSSNER